jgi:hypothetical protein
MYVRLGHAVTLYVRLPLTFCPYMCPGLVGFQFPVYSGIIRWI